MFGGGSKNKDKNENRTADEDYEDMEEVCILID